ncbi:MAG: hypothetical protein IKJ33_02775 [Clostridia bacterium]|nr:hypothetical protein [Clostridia bacterium]
MNKMNKILQVCMTFVLALTFLIAPFPHKKDKNAVSAPSDDIQLIDDKISNFVTISTDGQTLTNEMLRHFDTDDDGKNDTSYVFTNRGATMVFEPLKYGYETSFDPAHFYLPTTESVSISKLESEEEFPNVFTYKEEEYSYTISSDDVISIRNSKTNSSFTGGEFVSITEETSTKRTFTFITSYTLKADAPNTSFSFVPFDYITNSQKSTQYTINFERPIANFKNEDVTLFTCTGLDIGNTPYVNEKIEQELSYENLKFQITNNNYTETNPLYFDINHDGFVFTFKLFCKTFGADELLFVEYFDEQKEVNKKSLATKLDKNGNVIIDVDSPVYKYDGATTNFNTFSIDFNKTGRYEIAVYDETYKLKLSDNNYYSTSFYIKTSDSSNANSAFENAYAIMQGYDENNNISNYIVTGSTQNQNVQVTLKNLSFYFENDEVINSFTPTESTPALNVVEFIKTTLTGSLNIPESTYYSVETLKKELEKSPDIKFECSDDAFYEFNIYQYQKNADGSYSIKNTTHYQFTIVKNPKISFTVFRVDENNDRIPIPGTDRFETEIKEGEVPYTTTPINYKINIDSEMEIVRFFSSNNPGQKTFSLGKTYLNEYTINYAMQAVKIEQVEIKEGDAVLKVLGVRFQGVGDIDVEVTVNSAVQKFTVKNGETLQFENYGIYSFSIRDSMGTTGTLTIDYSKPVSMSAVILVVLLGVIVLAIALFVISSRGKMKTR